MTAMNDFIALLRYVTNSCDRLAGSVNISSNLCYKITLFYCCGFLAPYIFYYSVLTRILAAPYWHVSRRSRRRNP